MLDLNNIYCGDCAIVMKEINSNSIDLTVTSPPYDDLRTYKGYSFNFEAIAKELYRVTKKGGVVVWVVNDATIKGSETLTSFKQALFFKELGFLVHDTMIFLSDKPPLTHNRYEQKFEYMFVFSKDVKPKTFNPILEKSKLSGISRRGKRLRQDSDELSERSAKGYVRDTKIKGNVWFYDTGGLGASSKDVFKHPAVFPEKLAMDHINSWSNKGELVLDPMCGSGTTCKMASVLKRDFIGIEYSQEFQQIALRRLDLPLTLEEHEAPTKKRPHGFFP